MPWSGGTFTRIHNWVADRDANIRILASRHDAEDDNFAAGINQTRELGGTNTPTADLPMGGFKHLAVALALLRDQYGRTSQVQDGSFVFAADTGGVNTVVMTLAPAITAYVAGQGFRTVMNNANTGGVTVDINGVGAVALTNIDGSAMQSGQLPAGAAIDFIYTGTVFHLQSTSPTVTLALPQGYLDDPTFTRDSGDSFTMGSFQSAPLNGVSPVAQSAVSITRQFSWLFETPVASSGIAENTGSWAGAAHFSGLTDISFTTGPNNIAAGSGTPFSGVGVGDKFIILGSALNDGTYDVSAVNGGGTDIDVGQTVTVEGAGASITGYRVNDSSTVHHFSVVNDTSGLTAIATDSSETGANIGTDLTAGWTLSRRLWSSTINSSADLIDGVKIGNYWYFDVPQTITLPASGSVTVGTPNGIRTQAGISLTSTWGLAPFIPWHGLFFLTGATTPTAGDTTGWGASYTAGGSPAPRMGHGFNYIGTNTSRSVSFVENNTSSNPFASLQSYIDERKE